MKAPKIKTNTKGQYRIQLAFSVDTSDAYLAGIVLLDGKGATVRKVGTCVLDKGEKLRVFLETLKANGVLLDIPARLQTALPSRQIAEKKSVTKRFKFKKRS